MNEFWSAAADFLKNAGTSLLEALAILTSGLVIIRIAVKGARYLLIRSRLDGFKTSFLISILDFVLTLVLFFIVLRTLGIDTTSLVAIIAASGLAVGLALQDSLKNLASGIIILYTKPFKENDHVVIGSYEGSVKAIKIMTTEIATFDNKRIIIPNGKIISSEVTNYSARPTRRAEIKISLGKDSDPDKVRSLLTEMALSDERTLKTPPPVVLLSEIGESYVTYTLRLWIPNSIFWDVQNYLLEKAYKLMKENNIELPYNRIDLNTISEEKGGK